MTAAETLHCNNVFFADYGNAFTGRKVYKLSKVIAVDESICNGLLQAAGRLYHSRTDIEHGVHGLVVSMEPAATPADTFASSSIAAGKSESSKMDICLAKIVWSIYMAAAPDHMALTEAAWQAVWNWQATPGDGTQQL